MQKTVHRSPILRRSRPLRTLEAQNSNHYTSRTGIKRCARVNTRHPLRTLMRGRGNQEFRGCSNIRRPAVLTSVFMQADLKAVTWGRGPPGLLRGRLSATETYERA
jgi:hypothetical protein